MNGRRDFYRGVATLIVAALFLPAATGRPLADQPARLVDSEAFVLDNGMRFVLVHRPDVTTVAAGWVVGAGSADDPKERSGLAHLLEHLMFKGTDTIQPGELDLSYADAGATGLNALTQRDATAFFVSLPAEKLELWFWLESNRLLEPRFRQLEAERQVVREERQLRVDSSPTGALDESLQARLWGAHPYGRPISGEPTHLERLTEEEASRFFADHYGPQNLTAVLVGAFDRARVEALARAYFGRLPVATDFQSAEFKSGEFEGTEVEGPADLEGRVKTDIPPLVASTLTAPCGCRTQVRWLVRAAPFADPDGAATDVLVAVLNGRSGRLHRSLVLEQELAFAAFAERTALRQGGYLSLVAEAKEGVDTTDLLEALGGEIERLESQPADQRELDKARNRLRADAIRGLEEPSELMLQLAIHAGLGDIEHLNSWTADLEAVTVEDVRRVARDILLEKPRVVGLFDRQAAAP